MLTKTEKSAECNFSDVSGQSSLNESTKTNAIKEDLPKRVTLISGKPGNMKAPEGHRFEKLSEDCFAIVSDQPEHEGK